MNSCLPNTTRVNHIYYLTYPRLSRLRCSLRRLSPQVPGYLLMYFYYHRRYNILLVLFCRRYVNCHLPADMSSTKTNFVLIYGRENISSVLSFLGHSHMQLQSYCSHRNTQYNVIRIFCVYYLSRWLLTIIVLRYDRLWSLLVVYLIVLCVARHYDRYRSRDVPSKELVPAEKCKKITIAFQGSLIVDADGRLESHKRYVHVVIILFLCIGDIVIGIY